MTRKLKRMTVLDRPAGAGRCAREHGDAPGSPAAPAGDQERFREHRQPPEGRGARRERSRLLRVDRREQPVHECSPPVLPAGRGRTPVRRPAGERRDHQGPGWPDHPVRLRLEAAGLHLRLEHLVLLAGSPRADGPHRAQPRGRHQDRRRPCALGSCGPAELVPERRALHPEGRAEADRVLHQLPGRLQRWAHPCPEHHRPGHE